MIEVSADQKPYEEAAYIWNNFYPTVTLTAAMGRQKKSCPTCKVSVRNLAKHYKKTGHGPGVAMPVLAKKIEPITVLAPPIPQSSPNSAAQPRINALPLNEAHRPASITTATVVKPPEKCPTCNCLSNNLAKHYNKTGHGPGVAMPKTASHSRVQCPTCRCLVMNLAKHCKKTGHGFEVGRIASTATVIREPVSVKAIGSRVMCPTCNCLVKHLAKHCEKTGHGPGVVMLVRAKKGEAASRDKNQATHSTLKSALDFLAQKKSKDRGRGSPSVKKTHPAVIDSSVKNMRSSMVRGGYRSPNAPLLNYDPNVSLPENRRNMDAKLHWGGSFRDHGQFGSYPSHDAMDDESFE